jgi:rRNA maturation endonuclease Nob1
MSDLIKRSDAIQELAEYLMMDAQKEWAGTASEDIEDWKELAETVFDDIPSVEPTIEIDAEQLAKLLREGWTIHSEPKQGEWITERVWFTLQGTFRIDYQCSECEFKTTYTSKFCPQCGARMKENKPCRRCEDYAGNGMCCAKNYLVYDFSLAKDNCENESN